LSLPAPLAPLQTQELAIALDKAAGTVEDATVQEYIRGNLAQCAQQLHDRLLALQASAAEEAEQAEALAPPAKRSKRVGKAKAAPQTAPRVESPAMAAAAAAAAPPATLNTAEGYEQLAAVAITGQPDPRFTTASLLLARKPPSEQLVLAHVRQLQPESGSLDASLPLQGEALAAAAATALGTCAALSAESSDPADALRMFAPALGLLSDAWQLLSELEGPAAAFELQRLAARALASMHASLLAHAIPHSVSNSSTTRYWRSCPQQQPAAAAAAEAACAAVCGLRTSMLVHSAARGSAAVGRQRQQLEAQGAACAADIGLLAPHAASGVLSLLSSTVSCGKVLAACAWRPCLDSPPHPALDVSQLTEGGGLKLNCMSACQTCFSPPRPPPLLPPVCLQPLEQVQGSSGAARRFLVLYLGAAQQGEDGCASSGCNSASSGMFGRRAVRRALSSRPAAFCCCTQ
jgi:hypothetical protein